MIRYWLGHLPIVRHFLRPKHFAFLGRCPACRMAVRGDDDWLHVGPQYAHRECYEYIRKGVTT